MILRTASPEMLFPYLRQDFHDSAVKSLELLKRLVSDGYYRIYFFYNGNEFAGYACLAGDFKKGGTVLLDYFAVNFPLRGKGYGTRMLKKLRSYASKEGFSMIAEAERPEYAEDSGDRIIRERRIDFYKRNGALETSVTSTVSVDKYAVLLLSGEISDEKIAEFMKALYCRFFGEEALYSKVKIGIKQKEEA